MPGLMSPLYQILSNNAPPVLFSRKPRQSSIALLELVTRCSRFVISIIHEKIFFTLIVLKILVVKTQTFTSSSEGWKDTDIGWFPNKGSHRDTQFSNNLLLDFDSNAGLLVPSRTLSRST